MPAPEIEQCLDQVTDLISLPEVYLELRRLMDDPDADIQDFARIVGVDPNLCGRVLRVVNSAYYGFSEPVESVPRAINLIGIGPLHNLVLGVSAVSSLDLPNEVLPLETFWRASLFAGVVARLLGDRLGLADSDSLFIAGLLHDIGHLVLYARFPQRALAARRLAETRGQPVHEAEREIFGCDYAEIGALLMAEWNLSARLQALTRQHPAPLGAETWRLESALLHFAHARALASASEIPGPADNHTDAGVLEMIGLSQQDLELTVDEAGSISADMGKIILS